MVESNSSNSITVIPLLPLRDVVIYPHMVIPLFVGRVKSILALEAAMAGEKRVMLVAQRSATEDDPMAKDLFDIGTVANILQLLKLPDGTVKVLVEGQYRARIETLEDQGEYLLSKIEALPVATLASRQSEVLVRSVSVQFEQYVKFSKKVPQEVLTSVAGINDPSRLADTVAAHMALRIDEKQHVLEMLDLQERLEHIMSLMESEIDLLQVEKRVRGRVKKQMEKSQREYYLNEQMKAIQKELGDLEEGGGNEIDEFDAKIKKSGMPKEAEEKTRSELNKLKMMSPMSAEATVLRSYIDWMISVPWKKRSKLKNDIAYAEKTLNEEHYGLEEVKDRILEYLAVQSRVKKLNGPVLCLVGPPGVGKTSLGRSIASSTNRQFIRMALGGVRDEAEIRGHRRTYIGSMPGKLIQKLSKVGVKNPLFLLDEIDKMGSDLRGDPAAALLEVLDPEQNNAFNDHYLEVDYDLSDVMFICTSNSMNIPAPLLDRMEIIRIPGYTEDEKVNISQQYLIPKTIKNNGLKKSEIEYSEEALRGIIRYYTKEAGVRGLEREISKVCRKVVKENILEKSTDLKSIDQEALEQYLGVKKFSYGIAGLENRIGLVTGLAWTSVGGELLTIEAAAIKGKGKYIKTGSLGDVMQESIQAAITVVRSRARMIGLEEDFHEKLDLHVHVPEGATPKDGPSAGIAMCTALISTIAEIPVRADVAMTGEITLRGEVLKIGGLKEKMLAAHRGDIQHVIIPKDNEPDLKEIPNNILEDLTVHPVEWIDQVLALALVHMPSPIESETATVSKVPKEDKKDSDGASMVNTH